MTPNEEERWRIAGRVQSHEWSVEGNSYLIVQGNRQLFDRWRRPESRRRDVHAQDVFDSFKETHGEEGVATQLKKIIADTDRTNLKHFFPEPLKRTLKNALGRNKGIFIAAILTR